MSSIKHALMSAGREYWDEFTKVLQLQKLEVLARDEMLHLVSDLLESNHPELYAEFKRMVNEAVGWLFLILSLLACLFVCFSLTIGWLVNSGVGFVRYRTVFAIQAKRRPSLPIFCYIP